MSYAKRSVCKLTIFAHRDKNVNIQVIKDIILLLTRNLKNKKNEQEADRLANQETACLVAHPDLLLAFAKRLYEKALDCFAKFYFFHAAAIYVGF